MSWTKRSDAFDIQPQAIRSTFGSLSLHQADRIRLLRFPQSIIDVVHTTIKNNWPKGIQSTRLYHGSYEFKLHGYPWQGMGADAVHSRRLMCRILESLFNSGWTLVLSTDTMKQQMDKDSLLFRHQTPAPRPCTWFALSFSRSDRLRIIDAPPEVLQEMLRFLEAETGSHKEYDESGGGTHELKMRGTSWYAVGGDSTMRARELLLMLLEGLEASGFKVYASVDQKIAGAQVSNDADTWYCYRPVGWQVGMPVF